MQKNVSHNWLKTFFFSFAVSLILFMVLLLGQIITGLGMNPKAASIINILFEGPLALFSSSSVLAFYISRKVLILSNILFICLTLFVVQEKGFRVVFSVLTLFSGIFIIVLTLLNNSHITLESFKSVLLKTTIISMLLSLLVHSHPKIRREIDKHFSNGKLLSVQILFLFIVCFLPLN